MQVQQYKATIFFLKEVCEDDFFEGASIQRYTTIEKKKEVYFKENKISLLSSIYEAFELAYFDIDKMDFINNYYFNDIDNDSLQYQQNEDKEGSKITLSEDNKKGFLCSYEFFIFDLKEVIEKELPNKIDFLF